MYKIYLVVCLNLLPEGEIMNYYNANAQTFFDRTINVDMSSLYKLFLDELPQKGSILDVGCGSGRDTKFFLDTGYQVTAIEPAIELAKLAKNYTKHDILNIGIEDISFQNKFHGVWACASLLHLSYDKISIALKKIHKALLPNGILFISVKYGEKEEIRNGRFFCDYTQEKFETLNYKKLGFELIKYHNSGDNRDNRDQEKWLTVILKKKSINTDNNLIYNQNIQLKDRLVEYFKNSKEIILCVSFIRKSGLELLFDHLKNAIDHNKAQISILTSDYLNITEPQALYKLKSLDNNHIDLRAFKLDNLKSFHIKAYYMQFINEHEKLIIGSSNISKAALTNGYELNHETENKSDINNFLKIYKSLVENSSFPIDDNWLQEYQTRYDFSQENIKLLNQRKIPNQDFIEIVEEESKQYKVDNISNYEPINAQPFALYHLNQTREDGYKKAMIVMATGLGKTFLAAFDSIKYKKILFIAHREEILLQAQKTFKKIRPNDSYGFFMNTQKDFDTDITFASIMTIGKKNNYQKFNPEHFDYIIIDEVHHAVANSYKNIIDYFSPKFLLGLTATPDRMDNRDVYKLCDYNIAFECNFKVAINNKWLTPFEYHAIYDDLDYTSIPWRNGKYVTKALEKKYLVDKRAKQIIEKYNTLAGEHTIVFCCSIKHCDYIAQKFNDNGISTKAIHSKTKDRKDIINRFKNNDVNVLCVVDIFNEGIDIPLIDTIILLRPTQSYTIFIQQLGRGLRIAQNKQKLTVIDLIGNYKKAHHKFKYLAGLKPEHKEISPNKIIDFLPVGCVFNYDTKIIELYKRLKKLNSNLKERLIDNYLEVAFNNNNKPIFSLASFNIYSNIPARTYIKEFGSWNEFLLTVIKNDEVKDLCRNKKDLIEIISKIQNSKIGKFLNNIETTSMTRLYKLPTINSFVKDGNFHEEASINDTISSFKKFYKNEVYRKELIHDKTLDIVTATDKSLKNLIKNNPIKYLSKNKNSIIKFDKLNEKMILDLNNDDLSIAKNYSKFIAKMITDRTKFRAEERINK